MSQPEARAVSRGELLLLLLLLPVALYLRLRIALTSGPNFDECWHTFTGAVEPFPQFIAELRRLTHPPLSYLGLRLLSPLGTSLLLPRLVALLPGVASIVLLHRCAGALGLAPPLRALGALMLGLAYSHAIISSCVRGYSLATLLLLWAYLGLLPLLRDPSGAPRRAATALLLGGSLAMWTEYCAGFAVAAMLGALVLPALYLPGHRAALRRLARDRAGSLAAFAASSLGLVAYLKWASGPDANGHIGDFLRGARSPGRFLLDGFASDATAFSPLQVPGSGPGLWLALALVLGALGWLAARRLRPRSRAFDLARGSAPLIVAALWLVLFVLALCGLYPYGGFMRHQFVLFPFLILVALLGLDAACRAWPRGQGALCALAAAAVALSAWRTAAHPPDWERVAEAPFAAEVRALRQAMSPGDAVYLTQYTVYAFYGSGRDARWRLSGRCGRDCQAFQVTGPGAPLTAIQDASLWCVPAPVDGPFLDRLRGVMSGQGIRALWVFSMWEAPLPAPEVADGSARAEPYARAGLRLTRRLRFGAGEALRVELAPAP